MALSETERMAVRRQENESKIANFIPLEIWRYVEIFVAETIGTGMLLFFGCMSQIVWREDISLNPIQVTAIFACIISTIIQIFGHISQAHINPAVTLSFVLLGFTTPKASIVYVVAQFIGAYLGYALLMLVTPSDIMDITKKVTGEHFCGTVPHPSISTTQSISMEFIATAVLILLLCSITDPRNKDGSSTMSLKFAVFVVVIALTVGPYTGCSMNPARSFAPALWNGSWQKLWIYFLAPLVSALVVTIFYQVMFTKTIQVQVEQTEEDHPLNDVKTKNLNENQKENECTL